MQRKQTYQRKPYVAKKKPYVNKTKAMVTGNPNPTYLETLARGMGATAQLARAIAPIVGMINTEAKYFDQNVQQTYYNPGSADQINCLTGGIAQGLTDVTRIGDSILAKDIQIKINLFSLMSTALHQTQTRMILIVWKENAAVNAPTVAKLFTTPAEFLSGFNKDYTDQFVVLKDKIFTHQAQISAATNQDTKTLKIYKKLDYHMRFQAGSAADWTLNHVYLILRNTAPTSTNQASCDFYSRLNYTDN